MRSGLATVSADSVRRGRPRQPRAHSVQAEHACSLRRVQAGVSAAGASHHKGRAVIRLRVLSLGAGVQSTTMALMAAHGELEPMPDCAVFADTGWEPKAVYEHLQWVMSGNLLPFPVHVVSAGNLRDEIAAKRPRGKFLKVDIPAYVLTDGEAGGLVNRSCTRDYKIDPIRRKIREMLGIAGKRSPAEAVVEQWIGISLDEATRMKPAREPWTVNRWPLIEKRMSRGDCLEWLRRNDYPRPPKSSCIGCPFHSDDEWRALTPTEFADAVEVDARLRDPARGIARTKGALFLHRSCKPLDQVDLSTAEDRGQLNLFNNECEGMCGV
jgi:hypothetical protein